MKNIPIQLQGEYGKTSRAVCFAVKVVDKDGVRYGFTTLDANFTFDDGSGPLMYRASEELRPQNISSYSDMDVDSTDLVGWFGAEMERAALAGKLSTAEVTVYRVAYLSLWYGAEVVAYGTIGDIDYSAGKDGKRKIEYRGLAQALKNVVIDQWSLTCRADFGDSRCRKPLVWEAGVVSEVYDNYQRFKVSGVSRPDDWFTLGVLEFTSGDNQGWYQEIESWSSDGVVDLSFVAPFPVVGGVSVRLRQDCYKTESNCLAYNNIVNMRAEHLTPVQDQALMVPGAYIKSQNAL